MFRKIANPFVLAGLFLMGFGGFLFVQSVFCAVVIESVIGVLVAAAGWFVRRKGFIMPNTASSWIRFVTVGLPSLLISYAVSYFILMDRSRPTSWNASSNPHYFESSLRTAPGEWVDIARTFRAENSRQVTILNFVFWPADRVYFRLFPRSEEELDRIISNQHRSQSPSARKLGVASRHHTRVTM